MKRLYLLWLLLTPLLFVGCSDTQDEESASTTQGWHFQGRDCLACHNYDLGADKKLLVAGTLFKSSSVTDVNDLNESCGGEFIINFLDSSYAKQISSRDYEDINSDGYKGKGNIFMLSKMLDTLNGNYFIQIVDKDTNNTLALSLNHSFNTSEYNISNPVNYGNRLSCNACHNGDTVSYIYAQSNQDICE